MKRKSQYKVHIVKIKSVFLQNFFRILRGFRWKFITLLDLVDREIYSLFLDELDLFSAFLFLIISLNIEYLYSYKHFLIIINIS